MFIQEINLVSFQNVDVEAQNKIAKYFSLEKVWWVLKEK